MNKNIFITAILTLVSMTGNAQASKASYRLEGFVGDSSINGKAYILNMNRLSGEVIDSVNITNGAIEPKEGYLPDATICSLVFGSQPR